MHRNKKVLAALNAFIKFGMSRQLLVADIFYDFTHIINLRRPRRRYQWFRSTWNMPKFSFGAIIMWQMGVSTLRLLNINVRRGRSFRLDCVCRTHKLRSMIIENPTRPKLKSLLCLYARVIMCYTSGDCPVSYIADWARSSLPTWLRSVNTEG